MQTQTGLRLTAKVFAVIALAGLLVVPGTTNAQDVAVGQVTATVQTVLSVTATQALVFDAVQQGVPTAVGVDDIAAPTLTGIFSIGGANSAEVSAYFQLPDYLWNDNAGDEDRLVISFSATDMVVDLLPGTPALVGAADAGNTNPHTISEFNLSAAGAAAIYLGGKVWPTVDQRAQSYSADIVLTVAYTGN